MEVPNIGPPFALDDRDVETINDLLRSFVDTRGRPFGVLDLTTIDPSPGLANLVRQTSGTTRGATIPIVSEPRRSNTWTPDHDKHKSLRPGGKAAIRKKR